MNHIALWLVPSVIALALAGILGTFVILNLRGTQKLVESQNRMIQSMTNLAASKDLAAFTTMESMSPGNPNSEFHPQYVPMDDESLVERMAENYVQGGFDPSHAYSQEDPLADFGGTEAFR